MKEMSIAAEILKEEERRSQPDAFGDGGDEDGRKTYSKMLAYIWFFLATKICSDARTVPQPAAAKASMNDPPKANGQINPEQKAERMSCCQGPY